MRTFFLALIITLAACAGPARLAGRYADPCAREVRTPRLKNQTLYPIRLCD